METLIDFSLLDQSFWDAYLDLWQNSLYQSPFQAPLFLQFLSTLAGGQLAVFKGFRDGKLIGATFFYKRGGVYHFLSDMKTDHNYFILHRDATHDETKQYFRQLIQEMEQRKWTTRLNNQPSWASYMTDFYSALSESNLYWKISKYNPCLVLEAETPEALAQATNKQKLRQKLYRLRDMGEVTFEAFEGDEDLDHWLEEFYQNHIKRWKDTPTPSHFWNMDTRAFYKSCLQSWIDTHIAVRFSIRLNDKRIAFVTALLENGYLVHHTTTFDPDYEKQSPGLIIINLIGKWMAERGMTKMEFGDGGEAYKYQFTKNEFPLQNIFIASKLNLPFILKTTLINSVKENPGIHTFYTAKIRPVLLRSKMLKKMIT